jgi:hypothetical protein
MNGTSGSFVSLNTTSPYPQHAVPNRFHALLPTIVRKILEDLLETASRPCGETLHPFSRDVRSRYHQRCELLYFFSPLSLRVQKRYSRSPLLALLLLSARYKRIWPFVLTVLPGLSPMKCTLLRPNTANSAMVTAMSVLMLSPTSTITRLVFHLSNPSSTPHTVSHILDSQKTNSALSCLSSCVQRQHVRPTVTMPHP